MPDFSERFDRLEEKIDKRFDRLDRRLIPLERVVIQATGVLSVARWLGFAGILALVAFGLRAIGL